MSPPNRFIESFAPIFARLGIRRVRQFSRPIGSETGRPAALRPPADAEETAKYRPRSGTALNRVARKRLGKLP
jgi:hypothetical protein